VNGNLKNLQFLKNKKAHNKVYSAYPSGYAPYTERYAAAKRDDTNE